VLVAHVTTQRAQADLAEDGHEERQAVQHAALADFLGHVTHADARAAHDAAALPAVAATLAEAVTPFVPCCRHCVLLCCC